MITNSIIFITISVGLLFLLSYNLERQQNKRYGFAVYMITAMGCFLSFIIGIIYLIVNYLPK